MLHLLELFESNLLIGVLFVATVLVLFVDLMLKVLSYLLILLDDFLSLVINLRLCVFYGSLCPWLDHVASAVLTKLRGQVGVGPYDIWCPEDGRLGFHIEVLHRQAGSHLFFLELLLAFLLSKIQLSHPLPLFVVILLRLHAGHVTLVVLCAIDGATEVEGVLWDLLDGFLNIPDAGNITS